MKGRYPDPGEGTGVGIGNERDPKRFCPRARVRASSLLSARASRRMFTSLGALGEGSASCGSVWDVYRALRALDGHSCDEGQVEARCERAARRNRLSVSIRLKGYASEQAGRQNELGFGT